MNRATASGDQLAERDDQRPEFLAHLRKSRRQALRQRAQILMASMVYTPVYQIALVCRIDEAPVRRVIHAGRCGD